MHAAYDDRDIGLGLQITDPFQRIMKIHRCGRKAQKMRIEGGYFFERIFFV